MARYLIFTNRIEIRGKLLLDITPPDEPNEDPVVISSTAQAKLELEAMSTWGKEKKADLHIIKLSKVQIVEREKQRKLKNQPVWRNGRIEYEKIEDSHVFLSAEYPKLFSLSPNDVLKPGP
jgi:hypothetical protein